MIRYNEKDMNDFKRDEEAKMKTIWEKEVNKPIEKTLLVLI